MYKTPQMRRSPHKTGREGVVNKFLIFIGGRFRFFVGEKKKKRLFLDLFTAAYKGVFLSIVKVGCVKKPPPPLPNI